MAVNSDAFRLLLCVGIVLVPLIPALLLYFFWPTAGGEVTGDGSRFGGSLKFKFGGAAGLYLVIFFVLVAIVYVKPFPLPVPKKPLEVWTVRGRAQLKQPDGSLVTSISPDVLQVEVQPFATKFPDGGFELNVVHNRDASQPFPVVLVGATGFPTLPVFLEPRSAAKTFKSKEYDMVFNEEKTMIDITEVITLEKIGIPYPHP